MQRRLETKTSKTLKYNNMKLFNIWKWPKEIFDEVHQWRVVNQALKETETIKKLAAFKYELRTDRIGRIYTVINIPEELWPYEKQDQVWPWMVEQLRELDELLMERRLNDLVYPEVTKIEEAPAYLVVLSPPTDSLEWSKLFGWLFNLGLFALTIFTVNKICLKAFNLSIIDSIITLFS